MADFRKLPLKQFPRVPGRETPEQRYWKSFRFPVLIKQAAAVTCVDFAATAPLYAVTSSTRVEIFNHSVEGGTSEPSKVVSRFGDVAYSGRFSPKDHRLLVAGGAAGKVQLFDLTSRAVLRSWTGHRAPVHYAAFAPAGGQSASGSPHLMTASDDTTVRCLDIPSQAELAVLRGHTDYVRCGAISAATPDVWLSGSYDHTVRLWDLRSNEAVLTLEHGHPVDAVLAFASGGLVASAGGPVLKIWDVVGGGRLLYSGSNHQKAVTSLAFDGSGARLLSGSADQHVKCYDVTDYKVTHTIKYPSPVLAVAVSPENSHLVVGMVDGTLSVRQRVARMADVADERQERDRLRGGSYRYFVRGKSRAAGDDDFRVEHSRKERLRDYELLLRRFQYRKALDAALDTKQPAVVLTLLDEFVHRNVLKLALSGRDDVALEPLLTFLVAYIANPYYATLLIDVANVVLDLYTAVLGQSPAIDELFLALQTRLKSEIRVQKDMLALLGALDLVMASAANAHLAATADADSAVAGAPTAATAGAATSDTLSEADVADDILTRLLSGKLHGLTPLDGGATSSSSSSSATTTTTTTSSSTRG